MKHGTRRTLMVTISLSFFSVANATTIMTSNCPDKFVGKVIRIRDSKAPSLSNSLKRLDISFEELQTKTSKTITILKYGPTRFNKGETYNVATNQGLICSIQKL